MGVANSPNHVCVFFPFSKWRFHTEINNRFHLNLTHGNTWLDSELSNGVWNLCDTLSIKYLQHFSWYFLSELHRAAAEIGTECTGSNCHNLAIVATETLHCIPPAVAGCCPHYPLWSETTYNFIYMSSGGDWQDTAWICYSNGLSKEFHRILEC